ncbi:hypothetical protein JOH52_000632 [Sinorhizobium meliloti]|nr:hypothetical protein [Sinorhizobium meliloti]
MKNVIAVDYKSSGRAPHECPADANQRLNTIASSIGHSYRESTALLL